MIKDMVKLAIVAIMFVVLFMYPFALFWRGLVMVPDVVFRTPAYIDRVIPGSQAAAAGLRAGDLVLFVNDRLVQSCRTLNEELGLLEEGVPENDIMAAYCAAMAHRIMELLNRLGVQEKFVITGGIAKNEGVVKRLEKELGIKTAEQEWYRAEYKDYPFDTQIAGALGAALFAEAMVKKGKAKSVRKA